MALSTQVNAAGPTPRAAAVRTPVASGVTKATSTTTVLPPAKGST